MNELRQCGGDKMCKASAWKVSNSNLLVCVSGDVLKICTGELIIK